jgi:hypothetical protein
MDPADEPAPPTRAAGTTARSTVEGDPHLAYRYAGHVENGADSVSDPGMGGPL